MTSPLTAGPPGGIPGAPTQVVSGGIDQYLPLIVQILAQSAQRKQRKAEEAVAGIPEGTAYGSLTPDQQKAYRRATGVKDLPPDTIVRPLPATSPEATLTRLMRDLHIDPGSTMGIGMRTALAAQIATGAPHALTTPKGLAGETIAGEATGRASADIASARETEAGQFRRAVERGAAAPAGQNVEYTPGELAAFRRFNDFVPSEPIAAQLGGQAKAEVMKQALRVATDPNSTTWAGLLPEGVKPADVIGGIALGAGDIISSGISRRNIIEATAATEATKALFGAAEAASKAMGGRYSPTFIAAVMQGDPEAINTDAGQMVSRFLNAGFMAALTETATKGDPGSIAMQRLLELGRVPQIASNADILAQYSNLTRELLSASITRAHIGYDRPTEPGDAQKLWDQYNAAIRKQMGGMFSSSFWKGFTIEGADQPRAEPKPSQQEQDAAILSKSLQALFGDSLGVLPGSRVNLRGVPDLSRPKP